MKKKRVLFLCTANSCRSQMAEGIVNHFLGDKVEAFSAGVAPAYVHPRAIKSMAEIGIDISGQRSKGLEEFDGQNFDYVITLCETAREQCPLYFGGGKRVHLAFDDPVAVAGSEEEIMTAFRRVRDEMKDRLLAFFARELSDGSEHDKPRQ